MRGLRETHGPLYSDCRAGPPETSGLCFSINAGSTPLFLSSYCYKGLTDTELVSSLHTVIRHLEEASEGGGRLLWHSEGIQSTVAGDGLAPDCPDNQEAQCG